MDVLCDAMEVSRQGFHSWKKRGKSKRAREDEKLVEKIREFSKASRGTYGSPRIVDDFHDEGIEVGRRRVARLMMEQAA